jgi:apolipoprotein N-acyltransferase
MGTSAVIDGSGRIVALPGHDWASSKKVEGVITAAIPIDDRHSPYACLGDWLPALSLLGIAVGMVWPGGTRRRGESEKGAAS